MIQTITRLQNSKYRRAFDIILIFVCTLFMSAPVKLI